MQNIKEIKQKQNSTETMSINPSNFKKLAKQLSL